MAPRMTLFTSLLSPRPPLLPTSPKHSRARTRADSEDLGLLTWGRTGDAVTLRRGRGGGQTHKHLLQESGHSAGGLCRTGGAESSNTASNRVEGLAVEERSIW